ncbi:hypothetical protein PROFUN_12110 [Planoprotostelium fungivorum]|uniref:Transmembrane protein n=1 Tax=Planoprotostelium fungivorum TaxID=1890364 RepID=A0A2P6N8E6_9EUKA|nr:hypothetical protein PROFUN_12110 [Planoprotostelium fungivorum]
MPSLQEDVLYKLKELLSNIPTYLSSWPHVAAPLYPFLGLLRLLSKGHLLLQMGRNILLSTALASGYIFFSFAPTLYIVRSPWLSWLVPFKSYAKAILRLSASLLRILTESINLPDVVAHIEKIDTDWWFALLLVMIQGAMFTNFILGWRIRADARRISENRREARGGEAPREMQLIREQIYQTGWTYRITRGIIKRILLFPLYSVPLFGQILYAYSTGDYVGHELISALDPEMSRHLKNHHSWSLKAFGAVAGLLRAIPVLGFIFQVSNSVGAAMWLVALQTHEKKE